MAYLTATEARARLLSRFNLEADITEGDAEVASIELDASGPWIGKRYDTSQERAFPRSILPGGATGDGEVPEPVLDALVLIAYRIAEDEGPGIKSESVLDRSVTYDSPKISRTTTRIEMLLGQYRTSGRESFNSGAVVARWIV